MILDKIKAFESLNQLEILRYHPDVYVRISSEGFINFLRFES